MCISGFLLPVLCLLQVFSQKSPQGYEHHFKGSRERPSGDRKRGDFLFGSRLEYVYFWFSFGVCSCL